MNFDRQRDVDHLPSRSHDWSDALILFYDHLATSSSWWQSVDILMTLCQLSCLSPRRGDSWLDVLIDSFDCSQSDAYQSSNSSPPVTGGRSAAERWWTSYRAERASVCRRTSISVRWPFHKEVNCHWCAGLSQLYFACCAWCIAYGIRKIFYRHQVSKTSRIEMLAIGSRWRYMSRSNKAGLERYKTCRGAPWCLYNVYVRAPDILFREGEESLCEVAIPMCPHDSISASLPPSYGISDPRYTKSFSGRSLLPLGQGQTWFSDMLNFRFCRVYL